MIHGGRASRRPPYKEERPPISLDERLADNLVDVVLKRITEYFARGRTDLVRQWDRGNEPTSTEDLRIAMKGYRGLIDRLLEAEL